MTAKTNLKTLSGMTSAELEILAISLGEKPFRGRQIAEQEFSLDRVIGDTLAVYRDLLAAPAT